MKDVYHEKFIIKDEVIPASLLINNDCYLRQMMRLEVPKNIYTHISGVDLIRDKSGELFVLEDNLRTPSGGKLYA